MVNDEKEASSLLEMLPAIFQEDGEPDKVGFVGRFLLPFERILLGLGEVSTEAPQPGLEETIGGGQIRPSSDAMSSRLAGIDRYFEPGAALADYQQAPREFLQWLAGWVALTLREDWDEFRQRDLIAKAAQLYRLRGTKRGVEEFLQIYTRLGVQIEEYNTLFQIGVHSKVEIDTILDGGQPFYFHVHVFLPQPDPILKEQQRQIAIAIVELQKPAYTHFTLTVETPIFRINVHSQVGRDTLLG
jgi:phage tail-like protein